MREWLKLLLYSICIITLLLHLLPDGKFVKYVRFYAGLLFFLIALEPLLGLFLGNGELTKLLQLRFLKEEYRDLSGTVEGLGELKNARIREAYQKEISRQIAGIAASCTGKEASAKITFSADGYTPASAEIRLSSSELSHSFPAGAIFSDTPSDTAKAADSKLSLAQRRSVRNYFRYMHCRQERFSFLIQEAHPFELAKMEWWKKSRF
ncbi:MAG: stage III sporulation protein AF [Lachnospiraceae bacterium]